MARRAVTKPSTEPRVVTRRGSPLSLTKMRRDVIWAVHQYMATRFPRNTIQRKQNKIIHSGVRLGGGRAVINCTVCSVYPGRGRLSRACGDRRPQSRSHDLYADRGKKPFDGDIVPDCRCRCRSDGRAKILFGFRHQQTIV